jgi:tRNA threonylcarbamoyladenosine modification (KEOPS) complex Cgi121 subunit
MSDTMITDKGSARDNIIPGRLKSIVINSWLTISYAGLSTQAIDAIRKINKGKNISTKSSIDYLKQVSLWRIRFYCLFT